MVELLLPTPGRVQDIPILLDVVDVNEPVLLGHDVLNENNLFVDNETRYSWNRAITRQYPLKYEDRKYDKIDTAR